MRRGDGGGLVVRVFNPTGRETTVSITGRRGALVDLTGAALAPFEGAITLRPWEIATLRLEETS